MRRARRRAALAGASLSAVLAIAGCGGSGNGENGIAKESPSAAVRAAQAAVAKASSVHVAGIAHSAGSTVSLDLHIASGRGATGTVSEQGLSFKLIEVGGKVYIYGSPAFYSHFGGSAAAKLFAGKWLQASASAPEFSSLTSLTNLQALTGKLFEHASALRYGGLTSFEGQRALRLQETAHGGEILLATHGSPYPLLVAKSGSEGGRITFTEWGRPVALKAPAGAINVSELQHS
ncbi:MAG TPA: hypothetical protein VKU89_04560 [Solirubrobacteraceae bacterium]|nr:hypothetical protein [Solirubrobacteraceae bacterium]